MNKYTVWSPSGKQIKVWSPSGKQIKAKQTASGAYEEIGTEDKDAVPYLITARSQEKAQRMVELFFGKGWKCFFLEMEE